ncbi:MULTISPECIES: hypothetical protein [Caproicibacterium]|uniref:DUF4054 domain-containing protein n=1 Tax=Caproicibacterium argilliputei TaxID=3030016 RepID=A0AA97D9G1_9FIRM|nr:hypothetical protein [Caproicibacterium argilliputei]WOC33050.1 hypothetical protein PXC00_04000 [Caproicibacterium argilliputei]
MTADEWSAAGIPLPDEQPETLLMTDAALGWIAEHTTLDVENPQGLPASAKLFVLKYLEVMQLSAGVTAETIGGGAGTNLSQSFDTASKSDLLAQYAAELLGTNLKADVHFVSAKGRWRPCR